MKTLRDAWTLALMRTYPDLRHNPLVIVVLLLFTGGFPVFFLWIFGGQAQLPNGLVGAFVASAGLLALFTASQDVIWDNYTKLRQILVAKPISPVSYAIGTAISALIFSSPGLVVFGGLLLQRGLLTHVTFVPAIFAMILAWATISVLGFTISTCLLNVSPYRINALTNIIAFGVAFIPPVYYPADILGEMAWIALLTPTSAAASIVRTLTGLTTLNLWTLSWISLAIQTAIFTGLVILKAQWREK